MHKMDKNKIRRKFGGDFIVDDILYIMGIDFHFAEKIAVRFRGRNVLETCTGGGFSTIALAREAEHVVTIDIDPYHHRAAAGNIEKAGLAGKVTLIRGNALDEDVLSNAVAQGILAPGLEFDAAFLDPDWAVTGKDHVYRFRDSNTRPPADSLLARVQEITPNIVLILPPLIDRAELEGLPPHEFQSLYMNGNLELFVLCFGDLMEKEGETEDHIEVETE